MKLVPMILATVVAAGCSMTPDKRAAMGRLADRMQSFDARTAASLPPPPVQLHCRSNGPGQAFCHQ